MTLRLCQAALASSEYARLPSLPLEIWLLIIEQAVTFPRSILPTFARVGINDFPGFCIRDILLVNHYFHAEGMKVFLRNNTFLYVGDCPTPTPQPSLSNFANRIGEKIHLIRRLEFTLTAFLRVFNDSLYETQGNDCNSPYLFFKAIMMLLSRFSGLEELVLSSIDDIEPRFTSGPNDHVDCGEVVPRLFRYLLQNFWLRLRKIRVEVLPDHTKKWKGDIIGCELWGSGRPIGGGLDVPHCSFIAEIRTHPKL